MKHTKLKVTTIDEKDRELKGISSSEKSWHSDDSGPGEKWGFFSFAKNIMYVCHKHGIIKVKNLVKRINKNKQTSENKSKFLQWSSLGQLKECPIEQREKLLLHLHLLPPLFPLQHLP